MKSLFYGGAIAAVSGLLLGAGMKAPLAVEDAVPMAEVYAGFETAETHTYYAPQYASAQYVTPVAVPAAYDPLADYQALQALDERAAELTPAVYTVAADEPAPTTAPVYELAAAEPAPVPANLIRPAETLPEPQVTEQRQGFDMVEDEAADPS